MASDGYEEKSNDELLEELQKALSELKSERDRWRSVGAAIAAGMRGDTEDSDASSNFAAPVLIQLQKPSEHRFWIWAKRISEILAPFAAIALVAAFVLASCEYQNRIDQMHARTLFDVAREGRLLGNELSENGNYDASDVINFYYITFYLIEKGAIDDSLGFKIVLDLCGSMRSLNNFNASWISIKEYYPSSFQIIIETLRNLDTCTLQELKKIENQIPVLEK